MSGILESPGDPLSGEKAQVALTDLIQEGVVYSCAPSRGYSSYHCVDRKLV